MTPETRFTAETRPETMERHTRRMFHELRLSWESFSEAVLEHYHAHTREAARQIEFSAHADPFRRAKTNAKLLKRFVDADATVRMPVEIEESWVESLREPYRADCRRDLAARFGLLDVPLPDAQRAGSVASLAGFTREFADVLAAASPTLTRADLTHQDSVHLAALEEHLRAALASGEGLLRLVEQQQARLRGAGGMVFGKRG